MVQLTIDYSRPEESPAATLAVSLDEVDSVHLSVASRDARNRTALYQQKHRGSTTASRSRDPKLAAPNLPISAHYEALRQRIELPEDRRVLAFPISDLTANPLRPHFDATVSRAGDRLFFLGDEPIGLVRYTLLICYEQKGRTRFHIAHDVKLPGDGSLPQTIPSRIRSGLRYWMACPPLLIRGKHNLARYAVLDYDVRHLFGFENSFARFGRPNQAEQEAYLREIWNTFPDRDRWRAAVRARLAQTETIETGYHAALGLSKDRLIVVHRIATIPQLAAALKRQGATDAVLLDSGGSCAIWANWPNSNQGGVLANHWNFRPGRGAVLFLVLQGKRGIPTPKQPA